MSVLDKFLDAIRLNDDYDDDDEFFDDEDLEELEEEKPKRRFFKKKDKDQDLDELDELEDPFEKTRTTKKAKTVDPIIKVVVVLGTCFPVAATAAMLAEQEGQDPGPASKTLFLSTMASLVTVPVSINLIEMLFM